MPFKADGTFEPDDPNKVLEDETAKIAPSTPNTQAAAPLVGKTPAEARTEIIAIYKGL